MGSTSRCITDQGEAFASATVCLGAAGTLYVGFDSMDDEAEEDEDEDGAQGRIFFW
jgi:hypothetical protein